MSLEKQVLSKKWNGKSNGNTFGYSIFVFLLRKVGLRSAYFLLYVVTTHYCIFLFKKSKNSFLFYRKHIGLSVFRSAISVYKNYYIFGQTLIDRVAAMSGIKTNFTFDFEEEYNLISIATQKKGGLLVGAHLGNWEMAGHYLYRLDTPVNVVMYDNEYQKLKEYLDEVTSNKNYKIIAIKDDFSHIYEINEALNKNEFVCLHADRYFDKSRIVQKNFLGETAYFSESIFRMCSTFNVPVTFVYAFKETQSHYKFYATTPKIYEGNRNEKWQMMLSDFVNELETKTKQYPLHWFNYYNFWKL